MKIFYYIFLFCFLCFNTSVHCSLNEKNTNVVLLGDLQRTLCIEFWRENNDSIRPLLVEEICKINPEVLILLGDQVNYGSDKSEWEYFDNLTAGIRSLNVKILPVLGNHDYFGNNEVAFRNFFNRFPIINKGWYSKKINSVGFVFLNSNFDDMNSDEQTEQFNFLDSITDNFNKDTTIKFILGIWHHPRYTNSKVVEECKDTDKFLEKLKQSSKFRLVANGHCHSYEHFKNDNVDYIVSGGGGGPRQELTSGSDAIYQDLYKGEKLRDFNFLLLTIKKDSLMLEMFALDLATKRFIVKDIIEIK